MTDYMELQKLQQKHYDVGEEIERRDGVTPEVAYDYPELVAIREDITAAEKALRRRPKSEGGGGEACLVGGCERAVLAKGLCNPHYAKQRRVGVDMDTFVDLLGYEQCYVCARRTAVTGELTIDTSTGGVSEAVCADCKKVLAQLRTHPMFTDEDALADLLTKFRVVEH